MRAQFNDIKFQDKIFADLSVHYGYCGGILGMKYLRPVGLITGDRKCEISVLPRLRSQEVHSPQSIVDYNFGVRQGKPPRALSAQVFTKLPSLLAIP